MNACAYVCVCVCMCVYVDPPIACGTPRLTFQAHTIAPNFNPHYHTALASLDVARRELSKSVEFFGYKIETVTRVYKFILTPLTTSSRWSCRTIFGHLCANRLNLKHAHPSTLQSTHNVVLSTCDRLTTFGSLWVGLEVHMCHTVLRSHSWWSPCDHIWTPRASQRLPNVVIRSRYLIQRVCVLCNVFGCLGSSMSAHT